MPTLDSRGGRKCRTVSATVSAVSVLSNGLEVKY